MTGAPAAPSPPPSARAACPWPCRPRPSRRNRAATGSRRARASFRMGASSLHGRRRQARELGGPVQDDLQRERLGAALHWLHEEKAAVGADVVVVYAADVVIGGLEELLRSPKGNRRGNNGNRHHRTADAIEELLAVARPAGLGSAPGRDLPLSARAGESLNIDLGSARLNGHVRQIPAVGREIGEGPGRDRLETARTFHTTGLLAMQ